MKKIDLKIKSFLDKKTKKCFFISIFMSIIQIIGMIIVPILLPFIQELATDGTNGLFGSLIPNKIVQIIVISAILIGICLILLVAGFISNKYSVKFAKNLTLNMRSKIFKSIQELSANDINNIGQSSIINRITIDISNIASALETLTRLLLKAILIYFGGIIGLIVVTIIQTPRQSVVVVGQIPSWVTTVVIISITIFMLLVIVMIAKIAQKHFLKTQESLDEINFIAQEDILGQKAVKSFVFQNKQNETFINKNETLKNSATKAGVIMANILPIIYFFLDFAMVAAVWLSNKDSIDSMASIFMLISLIIMGMILSIVGIVQVSRALPSWKRVNEVIYYKSSIQYAERDGKLSDKKNISIKNLSFSYQNDLSNLTLKNINIEIEPNQVIGIIGPTGSGKSTLINVLLHNNMPTKGTVKLANCDIKNLSKNQIRELISFCPQNVMLFEGTIKSNILFGKQDANEAEIIDATKMACLYEFVDSKPEKFDLYVAQRGKNLSGGQKQRLSLARTLIKDAKYLFLDDATSALDMITERTICNELIKNNKKQTIIIASQRISAIKDTSKIIVMNNGEVIAYDTHKNLLKNCQYYYDVAVAQLGLEQVNNEINR